MLQRILLFFCLSLFVYGESYAQTDDYKLIVFEGSDWCSNCIRFDKTILRDSTFSNFINENNIYIEHIDFPQRKKLDKTTQSYNASIAEKYNFKGVFPTVLLIVRNTNYVFSIDYSNQSSQEFIALIESNMIPK